MESYSETLACAQQSSPISHAKQTLCFRNIISMVIAGISTANLLPQFQSVGPVHTLARCLEHKPTSLPISLLSKPESSVAFLVCLYAFPC